MPGWYNLASLTIAIQGRWETSLVSPPQRLICINVLLILLASCYWILQDSPAATWFCILYSSFLRWAAGKRESENEYANGWDRELQPSVFVKTRLDVFLPVVNEQIVFKYKCMFASSVLHVRFDWRVFVNHCCLRGLVYPLNTCPALFL